MHVPAMLNGKEVLATVSTEAMPNFMGDRIVIPLGLQVRGDPSMIKAMILKP